jgi:hypothetical protein
LLYNFDYSILFAIFAACYYLNIIMAEYKVTPMKDRTVCGWIAVASFIIGLVLCDWVMGAKAPGWASDLLILCGITMFISTLLWVIMLCQDDNI